MGARTAFWISSPAVSQLRLDISHCRARDEGLDTYIIRYLNFSDTRHYTYFCILVRSTVPSSAPQGHCSTASLENHLITKLGGERLNTQQLACDRSQCRQRWW